MRGPRHQPQAGAAGRRQPPRTRPCPPPTWPHTCRPPVQCAMIRASLSCGLEGPVRWACPCHQKYVSHMLIPCICQTSIQHQHLLLLSRQAHTRKPQEPPALGYELHTHKPSVLRMPAADKGKQGTHQNCLTPEDYFVRACDIAQMAVMCGWAIDFLCNPAVRTIVHPFTPVGHHLHPQRLWSAATLCCGALQYLPTF